MLPSCGSEGDIIKGFLDAAAEFANSKCWGSLVATVITHPASVEAVGADVFDGFIAQLRYGCVTINVPSTIPFVFPVLPWGAYPGE